MNSEQNGQSREDEWCVFSLVSWPTTVGTLSRDLILSQWDIPKSAAQIPQKAPKRLYVLMLLYLLQCSGLQEKNGCHSHRYKNTVCSF